MYCANNYNFNSNRHYYGYSKEKKRIGYIYIIVLIASVVILIICGYTAWKKLDIVDYMSGQGEMSTFINDNYVDAKDVNLHFLRKKEI